MIITMSTDRERTQADPFCLGQLISTDVWTCETGSDASVTCLAFWVILCYRFSGQAQITIDSYSKLEALRLGLVSHSLALEGSERIQDLIEKLRSDKDRVQVPSSNCAFFTVWEEPELLIVCETMQRCGYELALACVRHECGWRLTIFYNSAIHDAASVERFLTILHRWLGDLKQHENLDLDRLPLMGPSELEAWQQVLASQAIVYPEVPIYELILTRCRENPLAIAVSYGAQDLSYGEILQRSSDLAALLRTEGVTQGSVVAVCLPPCGELLIALLGLWQVGAVYCPLDPTHPEVYIQHMLDLASPLLILTHSRLAPMNCFQSFRQIVLDGLSLPSIAVQHTPIEIGLDQPAYLFFTSGTTGKPKGVLASHRNLAQYIHAAQQAFAFGPYDVFISMARYTFSISLFELISPLCVGARLLLTERHEVLNPERLLQLLQSVTVLHAGPSLLTSLFWYLRSHPQAAQTLPHLRHVSSGGDIVSGSILEDMKRVFSQAEIFVLYGSTEIACMGTLYAVSRSKAQTRSLVGQSFPGMKVQVVDRHLQLLPYGVVGDICFAGSGLALGYYKRPDLEEGKFIVINGERFYKMGDVGRLQADGMLEMLGRSDFQVQLRGMRIELVGIENTVREIGLAQQCAIVHKREQDQEFLIFYLLEPKTNDIAVFRKQLGAYLPDFMLPRYLQRLDKMPLTVNGKLDRKALQSLPWQPLDDRLPEPPAADHLRQELAQAFAKALNRPHVGIEQNFFDLGGHSMLAIVLLQNIQDQLGIAIPPQVFFEQATVEHVAAYLEAGQVSKLYPIALNQAEGKPKLFMLAGVQTYRPLARHLADAFSAFAVFTPEELSANDATSESLGIQRLAEHYLNQILAMQPQGPYHLLGYSFAGIVVYEVAQKLRAQGKTVELLVLIDAIIPEWNSKWQFRVRQLRRAFRRPPGDVVRFMARRFRETVKPKFSELNQHKDDPKLGDLQEQRVFMKSVAAVSYLAQRQCYPDRCLLIVSEDRLRQDPLKSRSCGWSEVVPLLEVHSVAGDHFKMVESEADVTAIARIILDHYQRR